jgi:hypothetical protein
LKSEKVHVTQISNYSTVLFFALTRIAIKKGVPLEAVNGCSTTFLLKQQGRCNANPKYLGELRTSAKWVVQQQIELLANLDDSSWDMFLVSMLRRILHEHTTANDTYSGGPSIHSYERWTKSAFAFKENVEKRLKPGTLPQHSVSLNLMFLISIIVGNRYG